MKGVIKIARNCLGRVEAKSARAPADRTTHKKVGYARGKMTRIPRGLIALWSRPQQIRLKFIAFQRQTRLKSSAQWRFEHLSYLVSIILYVVGVLLSPPGHRRRHSMSFIRESRVAQTLNRRTKFPRPWTYAFLPRSLARSLPPSFFLSSSRLPIHLFRIRRKNTASVTLSLFLGPTTTASKTYMQAAAAAADDDAF